MQDTTGPCSDHNHLRSQAQQKSDTTNFAFIYAVYMNFAFIYAVHVAKVYFKN